MVPRVDGTSIKIPEIKPQIAVARVKVLSFSIIREISKRVKPFKI